MTFQSPYPVPYHIAFYIDCVLLSHTLIVYAIIFLVIPLMVSYILFSSSIGATIFICYERIFSDPLIINNFVLFCFIIEIRSRFTSYVQLY